MPWNTTSERHPSEFFNSLPKPQLESRRERLSAQDLIELGPDDSHTQYYIGATHLSAIDALLGIGAQSRRPVERKKTSDSSLNARTFWSGKREEKEKTAFLKKTRSPRKRLRGRRRPVVVVVMSASCEQTSVCRRARAHARGGAPHRHGDSALGESRSHARPRDRLAYQRTARRARDFEESYVRCLGAG